MIFDKQTLLSEDQDLAQAAGTYVSTNTIDLSAQDTVPPGFQARGTPPYDIGRGGQPPELVIQVTETFTSGGAATLKAEIIMSANADLSSPTVLQSSAVIALATLVAGYQFRLALPPGISARYLGVQYVIATATTTAGKCTAGLVADRNTLSI